MRLAYFLSAVVFVVFFIGGCSSPTPGTADSLDASSDTLSEVADALGDVVEHTSIEVEVTPERPLETEGNLKLPRGGSTTLDFSVYNGGEAALPVSVGGPSAPLQCMDSSGSQLELRVAATSFSVPEKEFAGARAVISADAEAPVGMLVCTFKTVNADTQEPLYSAQLMLEIVE